MAAARRLVHGSFRRLEAAFIEEMKALRSASPVAACAVLVPNRLLQDHLRRALALAGCPHVNVHFLTFRNLADRLAKAELAREGLSYAPPMAMQLLAQRAAAGHADALDYFGGVADREGFQRALLETLKDLKDAGATPEEAGRAETPALI